VATPAAAVPARKPQGDEIVVDGLDDSAWGSPSSPTDPPHEELPTTFDPSLHGAAAVPAARVVKQYKLLTPRDRYFEGKFDLARLEEALNHFARDGWAVRGMATPHVMGFQGEKEELVVLLER
jgi:hypothetical protein